MPASSALASLPPDLLNDLGDRLKYSDYRNLAGHLEWLNGEIAGRGIEFRISSSALGRWSKARREKAAAIADRVAFASGMASIARDAIPDLQAATELELQISAYENTRGMRGVDIAALDPEDQMELIKAQNVMSLAHQRMMRSRLMARQMEIFDAPAAGKPAKDSGGKKAAGGEKGERNNEPGLPDDAMDRIDEVLMPDGEED